jgi:hypothetical protein
MRRSIIFLAFLFQAMLCIGQEVSGVLDWVDMKIDVSAKVDLKSRGIKLPSGRIQAENSIFGEFFSKTLDFIYTIPYDSSSVLGDFVESGELLPQDADDIVFGAKSTPPAISTDMMSISGSYSIALKDVAAKFVRHGSAAGFDNIINPKSVPSYTGIIIIANDELDIHGRNSSAFLIPCLFPKIWDTDMNLIFDKKFTVPGLFGRSTMVHYAQRENIFRDTPSGLSSEIEKLVGNRPLRIIARGVFGIRPSDPIIDVSDALIIISSEENKQLLREGRVVFIASPDMLKTKF